MTGSVLELKKNRKRPLSNEQQTVLRLVRRAIKGRTVNHFNLEDGRWWHISPKYLAKRAPQGSYVNDPELAEWLLRSLHSRQIIQIREHIFFHRPLLLVQLPAPTTPKKKDA